MENLFDDDLYRMYDEVEIKKIIEEELELAMRTSYSIIKKLGWKSWMEDSNMNYQRKENILKKMLRWYEDREEYEQCSFIQKGLQYLKENCK
jgi:hypothetical protein